MTKNSGVGRGLGSLLAGVLLSLFGLLWFAMVVGMIQLWIYRDRYIAGELEVTKYHYIDDSGDTARRGGRAVRSRRSDSANQIEGVLHPLGVQVFTTDRYVKVSKFDNPDDMVGYQPLRQEVEGKRYPVWHWPDHESGFLEPPATFSGDIPTFKELLIYTGILAVMLGGGVLLVMRGYRLTTATRPAPNGPGYWPAWTGGAMVLTVVAWSFFALLVNVALPSRKLNRTATAVLERTPQEFAVAALFATLFGGLCLFMTWQVVRAVRQRMQPRG